MDVLRFHLRDAYLGDYPSEDDTAFQIPSELIRLSLSLRCVALAYANDVGLVLQHHADGHVPLIGYHLASWESNLILWGLLRRCGGRSIRHNRAVVVARVLVGKHAVGQDPRVEIE